MTLAVTKLDQPKQITYALTDEQGQAITYVIKKTVGSLEWSTKVVPGLMDWREFCEAAERGVEVVPR